MSVIVTSGASAPGPQGPTGSTGPQGATGPAGPTGPQGPTGTPAVLVAASGDTTGATDLAAINSALAAGNRVFGQPGASYYINNPIIVPSSGYLDMTGATVNLATGVVVNLIRNSGVTAHATSTDGASTLGSTTLTSASMASQAVVGNVIGVDGAGFGGATWYSTVTAVGSGTVTLSVAAQTNVASGATCHLYTTRDHDITIIGGTWVCGDQTVSAPTSSYLLNQMTTFRRVDRLTLRGMNFQSAGTQGLGGRFTISTGDCNDVTVDQINFIRTSGDGVHIHGPANNVNVTNIHGNSGDDFVVFATCDGAGGWPGLFDTQGSVSNCTAENLYPNGAWSAGRIYDFDWATPLFTMTDVTFRSVKGSSHLPLQLGIGGAQGAYTGIRVEDINLTVPNNTPMVYCNSAHFNDLTVDGFSGSATWLVQVVAALGTLRIANGAFAGTNLVAAGAPVAIKAANLDLNTTGPVVNVTGSGATPVTAQIATFSQAGAGALFAKDGTQTVTVSGPSLQSGTAALTAGASSSIVAPLLTAAGRIRLSNVASGGTPGALYSTITAGTGFVIHSTSGADTSTVFWEIVQF